MREDLHQVEEVGGGARARREVHAPLVRERLPVGEVHRVEFDVLPRRVEMALVELLGGVRDERELVAVANLDGVRAGPGAWAWERCITCEQFST